MGETDGYRGAVAESGHIQAQSGSDGRGVEAEDFAVPQGYWNFAGRSPRSDCAAGDPQRLCDLLSGGKDRQQARVLAAD